MKHVLVAIFVAMLLGAPLNAHADIAPPAQPPGSNLQPGTEATQVRMLAETVKLDVRPGSSGNSLGLARVTADFTMHNAGRSVESMAARFPIGANTGYFTVNELRDLQVKENGRTVATRRIMGEDPYFPTSEQVPWAEFDVTFPAGQDTAVEVQYTLEASGEYPFIWFKYILSTGAAWKDSIGSADIIVQLPYEANALNLLLDTDQVWFGTTRGGIIDGKTIRWHFENLEPAAQDNFEVNLVMPSAWERLLAEQGNVARNPANGEAWGRLAKLCKELAFSSRGKGFRAANELDPGGEQLYHQSIQAYDKAVGLLPRDPLWHAGYADLLSYHAYFDAFNGHNTTGEATHGMREIQAALALAPNDPKVQQIAGQVASFFPDAVQQDGTNFTFYWLTTTPAPVEATLAPTSQLSENITASQTPAPMATPTMGMSPTAMPTPATESRPSLPVCGSALLLPLLLVAIRFNRAGGNRC